MLKRLRNIYRTIPSQPYLQNLAGDLRKQLFQIEIQEAQGIKICAKVKYELEGEKCSKLFFQQKEKRKDSQQTMYSLKSSENGKLLLNQTEMQGKVRNFFRQLYTENTENQKRMELNPCFDLIGLNGQKDRICNAISIL